MTTELTRGLSWSKKWHILDDSERRGQLGTSLCGAYVYQADDRNIPKHLQLVFEGAKNADGDCKLCARSARIPVPEDILARVRALADKWDNAIEATTGNPSIVAKAFAAELYQALGDDR